MSPPSLKLSYYDTYISSTAAVLCPFVKVGYATEKAETKKLFWAERLYFPQRPEGVDVLSLGQN